ncbi:MAG: DNA adenine methylase [Anaerolineae bacterium]|nr:DNA adenine methylase [Anaerolineae bacterium]
MTSFTVPHPIQYQGSKRSLAPTIIRYLPRHFQRLVEPFAGSGALSIACAARGLADQFWLNDVNKPLANLLSLIVNHPKELAESYARTWNAQHPDSLEHYYRVREDFNRTNDPELFLYLLARCVKGAVRYNSDGLFNQSPDKRRQGTRPETMSRNIWGVSRILKGRVVTTSLDYQDVLANVGSGDVVYMDPPYQGVCGDRDSRYFSGIEFDPYVEALRELNKRDIRYVVSYDGRTGTRTYGKSLPQSLQLVHVELDAGRSSQATLLGRDDVTVESLYLSAALASEVEEQPTNYTRKASLQMRLLDSNNGTKKSIQKSF